MITITKAKVLKESVYVEFLKTQVDRQPSEHKDTYKDLPHEDLRNAFNDLSVHAALLFELISSDEIKNISSPEHSILAVLTVTGFSFSGDDKNMVVLTGQKTFKNGKVGHFNTPVLNLEDDEGYAFTLDLSEKLDAAREEVIKYLGGKAAADPQLSMDFEEPVTSMQVLPEEKQVFNTYPNGKSNASPEAMGRVA